MASTRNHVRQLMEMLRVQALLEQKTKTPAFSHALGLNYAQISESQFVPVKEDSGNFYSFEYTVPSQLRLPSVHSETKTLTLNNSNSSDDDSTNNNPVSLSTLLAIIDEVTSWSSLIGDSKRRRFGVSINLRAEWAKFPSPSPIFPGQTIRINTTNSKIGKTIGFVRAEICDSKTGERLALGSHIKFLDMGPMMNFLLSFWPLTKKVLTTLIPYDVEMEKQSKTKYQLPHLFQSLDLTKDQPTFTPDKIHSSLGGPLHGGCQAVLHELVGSLKAQ